MSLVTSPVTCFACKQTVSIVIMYRAFWFWLLSIKLEKKYYYYYYYLVYLLTWKWFWQQNIFKKIANNLFGILRINPNDFFHWDIKTDKNCRFSDVFIEVCVHWGTIHHCNALPIKLAHITIRILKNKVVFWLVH